MNKTCNHRHGAESRCNHSVGCRCMQPRTPPRVIPRQPDLAPALRRAAQSLGARVTIRGGAVYT